MGKQGKRTDTVVEGDVPVVGMREPCPCGSGRRYKACHGKDSSRAVTVPARPFEGFASECDIVAMRELVPSATTTLTLKKAAGGRTVTLATVLPLAWPGLVRENGDILLGLQVTVGSGDASRDLADVLMRALETEAGNPVPLERVGSDTPQLQDLVETGTTLKIDVHEDFAFWIDSDAVSDDVQESLERAKEYAHPTVRLTGVDAAYWTQMGEKEHLRWIMPHPEEKLLDALARLHAADASSLGPDTRVVGMFRAQGLVIPVWDLPLGMGAAATEEPAAAFGARLTEALAASTPLTDAERRARAGLTTRQVTLR
ncbi:MAG: topoisomerase II [Actinobacteria bacterium]|nr:topoisomerase II [Actinomycetota bacterium]